MSVLSRLSVPIVQAPMAGGPSTPALAAAVSDAGGLGFVAAGYRTVDAMRADLRAVRAATPAPFGINVFAPGGAAADPVRVAAYAAGLADDAARAGVAVGTPRFDDDGYAAKLDALVAEMPAVVSFTFGCPDAETVARVRAAGGEAWATVTDVGEARQAAAAGVDALVVQGVEAGGHRGTFTDRDAPGAGDTGLLALLALVRAAVDLPLVATGGIADGRGVAAVLAAGAAAAQLGTAFLLTPEADTAPGHRAALVHETPTAVTRAFSGRRGRGIVNRFHAQHTSAAPSAYPEIHHVTRPLRATGDPDLMNLWAGQAHALAVQRPAAELVAELHDQARDALEDARRRCG